MTQINIALDLLCVVVLILILTGLEIYSNENIYFRRMTFTLLVIQISDIGGWTFNGKEDCIIFLYITNSVNYISGYLIINYFIRYLKAFIFKHKRIMNTVIHIFDVLCIISIAATLLNIPFGYFFAFDGTCTYFRGKYYILSQLYPAVALVLILYIIFISSEMKLKNRLIFSLFPIFPLIGIGIDFLVKGLTLTYIGAFIAVMCIFIYIYAEKSRQVYEKEKEMMENQISIMLSQIQPHFLYNALSSIQSLCHENPKAAEKAIGTFADFLRGNMDSLTKEKNISFKQELNHVREYLEIEQIRFPDKLKIEYDIRATLFRLPTLTLQPIVENAVRYGITKRKNGGTIKISSKETEKAYVITVDDDGAGFDSEKPYDNRSTHIGIENVRSRLDYLSGGTLTIDSKIGIGTIATITIPKGGNA